MESLLVIRCLKIPKEKSIHNRDYLIKYKIVEESCGKRNEKDVIQAVSTAWFENFIKYRTGFDPDVKNYPVYTFNDTKYLGPLELGYSPILFNLKTGLLTSFNDIVKVEIFP